MSKNKILVGGLVALLSGANLALPAVENNQELEKRTQTEYSTTWSKPEEKEHAKEKSNYEITEDWYNDFFKDYIEKCKDTWWFSGSIRKNGRKKFEEQYLKAHVFCLKLTEEKIQESRKRGKKVEITEREYLDTVEEMCKIESKISCGYVNYTAPEFKNKQRAFVEIITGHFTKLLLVDQKCKDYRELAKKAYSAKKNYEEYVDRQNIVNDNGLEALRNTMSRMTRGMGGNKEIDFLKLTARENYGRTVQYIFGD